MRFSCTLASLRSVSLDGTSDARATLRPRTGESFAYLAIPRLLLHFQNLGTSESWFLIFVIEPIAPEPENIRHVTARYLHSNV